MRLKARAEFSQSFWRTLILTGDDRFSWENLQGWSSFPNYEGTSFSGKKCSKDIHLSALMLSCLLTDFDYSSNTVKLTHKYNISSGVYLGFFQAKKV